MKKAKRFIALSAAFLLVCLSATGCNALDELREAHGFYTETGSIMLGDTEYLPLPDNQYFSPFGSSGDTVNVTDKDVPVLLSGIFGNSFTPYNDGVILENRYSETYYCRADKYDEVAAQMAGEFAPTGYCYTYSVLDTETEMYEERGYLLTEEQEQAIENILATVEGVERAENAHYTSDYSVALMACTDNMLFRDWWYDIEKTEGTYYIVGYDNIEYTVPFEMNAVFDAIMKNKIDAEKAEEQYYSDLYGYEEDEYMLDYEVI